MLLLVSNWRSRSTAVQHMFSLGNIFLWRTVYRFLFVRDICKRRVLRRNNYLHLFASKICVRNAHASLWIHLFDYRRQKRERMKYLVVCRLCVELAWLGGRKIFSLSRSFEQETWNILIKRSRRIFGYRTKWWTRRQVCCDGWLKRWDLKLPTHRNYLDTKQEKEFNALDRWNYSSGLFFLHRVCEFVVMRTFPAFLTHKSSGVLHQRWAQLKRPRSTVPSATVSWNIWWYEFFF